MTTTRVAPGLGHHLLGFEAATVHRLPGRQRWARSGKASAVRRIFTARTFKRQSARVPALSQLSTIDCQRGSSEGFVDVG